VTVVLATMRGISTTQKVETKMPKKKETPKKKPSAKPLKDSQVKSARGGATTAQFDDESPKRG